MQDRQLRGLTARPCRPDMEAGMRMEPPPSNPMATGTRPAATATAEPWQSEVEGGATTQQ